MGITSVWVHCLGPSFLGAEKDFRPKSVTGREMSGAENVSVLKYVSGSHESSISRRCLVNQVENVSGQKMSE